ncbi:acyltransferase domain-containing protein [Spirochaeta isovalerica]|uniref:Malonyl CoA-acyl carrier protein transacylase n=1 Tax=Spirochaeta isovalerica TaxID=150 RepID=A0A841R3R0_9SPIO|nr:[acyl-carrier-protein] S-malonyltransferase [Spirochaeta isovalerica]
MKTCFLFPGQGAQYPGMGRDLWENSEEVKELFKTVSNITGKDMADLLFEGSEEDLKATDNTQLAITLANVSSSIVLKEKGIEAHGAAGFSLGEYAALWQAGILGTEDLFRIVKMRGEVMEAACNALDGPEGRPGMAAVVGLASADVKAALDKVSGTIYMANDNSPIQTVIAGEAKALEAAEAVMDEAGAMRYVVLKVSGPFHTPFMDGARQDFVANLKDFTFKDPIIPVYSNVTGKIIASGSEAKELAGSQIISPVQWVAEEQSILDDGYERILEVGPGMVLTGLWKSFYRKMKCQPAGKIDAIEKLV